MEVNNGEENMQVDFIARFGNPSAIPEPENVDVHRLTNTNTGPADDANTCSPQVQKTNEASDPVNTSNNPTTGQTSSTEALTSENKSATDSGVGNSVGRFFSTIWDTLPSLSPSSASAAASSPVVNESEETRVLETVVQEPAEASALPSTREEPEEDTEIKRLIRTLQPDRETEIRPASSSINPDTHIQSESINNTDKVSDVIEDYEKGGFKGNLDDRTPRTSTSAASSKGIIRYKDKGKSIATFKVTNEEDEVETRNNVSEKLRSKSNPTKKQVNITGPARYSLRSRVLPKISTNETRIRKRRASSATLASQKSQPKRGKSTLSEIKTDVQIVVTTTINNEDQVKVVNTETNEDF